MGHHPCSCFTTQIAGFLAACSSTPSAKTPLAPIDPPPPSSATLGAFGVYAWQPHVDPFPDAPSDAGWGVGRTADGAVTHFLVVHAEPDRPADDAIARRAATAKLPPGTRLLYAGSTSSSGALDWTLSSVVVASKPVFEAADVATCQIVGRADVVIDITHDQTESHDWPWVHLTLTPQAVGRLKALVDPDATTRLYLALGDDVVDQWIPAAGHDLGTAELKIPQPDAAAAWAYVKRNPQLCPTRAAG
jgi:hypothetical protein